MDESDQSFLRQLANVGIPPAQAESLLDVQNAKLEKAIGAPTVKEVINEENENLKSGLGEIIAEAETRITQDVSKRIDSISGRMLILWGSVFSAVVLGLGGIIYMLVRLFAKLADGLP